MVVIMSEDDLRSETIETDPECNWVPEGHPFSLLKLVNEVIENDYVDKPETPGPPPGGTTNTGKIAKNSPIGGLYFTDFRSNDVFNCAILSYPPVRPELEHLSVHIRSQWGFKGQVLKRPYYKFPTRHTTSYSRKALFVSLSLTFSFQFVGSVFPCLANATVGIMVPATGSGGTVELSVGPLTTLSGDFCHCDDCAEHIEDYTAHASLGYLSNYSERNITEPILDPNGNIIESWVGKSWDIAVDLGTREVCIIGPAGTSCNPFSAATAPQNCFCFGSPFAAAHTGVTVLDTLVVSLEVDWMDGITEDEEGNQYFLGYRIQWP
jgi:hypothetical protein